MDAMAEAARNFGATQMSALESRPPSRDVSRGSAEKMLVHSAPPPAASTAARPRRRSKKNKTMMFVACSLVT